VGRLERSECVCVLFGRTGGRLDLEHGHAYTSPSRLTAPTGAGFGALELAYHIRHVLVHATRCNGGVLPTSCGGAMGHAATRVAVLFAGELRFASESHLELVLTQCQGSVVYVATYEAFERLALRLTGGVRSRVAIVSSLAPDSNHTISFREANRLRAELGLPLMQLSNGTALRTKGVHKRTGEASPTTAQQWATLDAALARFEHELGNATLVVRSRTDATIISAASSVAARSPFGSAAFRYASLKEPPAGVLCANSDVVFYARSQTFVRVFRSLWWHVNSVYAALPTPSDAYALSAALRNSACTITQHLHHKQLGCNALGPDATDRAGTAGHVWAWRKLPKVVATSGPNGTTTTAWLAELPPDWRREPPSSLGFHSEQAFAYHVLVTSSAPCCTCELNSHAWRVKLLANRSQCAVVPSEHNNESSCRTVN
jgi:hypothetical protein